MTKKIFLCALFSIFNLVNTVFAQQWVMDQIDEESEGGPFSGIMGAILLFGGIWLISNLFGKKKKDKKKSSNISNNYTTSQSSTFYDKSALNKSSSSLKSASESKSLLRDENISGIKLVCDTNDPFRINSPELKAKEKPSDIIIVGFNKKIGTKEISRSEYNKIIQKEADFKAQCIKVYADFIEVCGEIIIIKEDGEYRQIVNDDDRFNILYNYIYLNHKDRYNKVCEIGNKDILDSYTKGKNALPNAKTIEEHGCFEKEFNGKYIVMLKAYYIHDSINNDYNSSIEKGQTLEDFCLSLGMEFSIYIHRYIQRPMDYNIYFSLKEITSMNYKIKDYYAYRKRLNNRINNATKIMTKNEEGEYIILPTKLEIMRNEDINNAKKEVEQMIWHL